MHTHTHKDKGSQFQLVWDIFILCNKSYGFKGLLCFFVLAADGLRGAVYK